MLKKSLELLRQEAAESGTGTLKRTLNGVSLIALGIGVIIGAGLFSLTGIAAANHAGPAVTLSFLVAAVGCAFSALCYAEFAALVPVAGSAYTYAYATMGELFAWIIGWDLVLEYSVGAATVAISWSQYLLKFLSKYGLHLPPRLVMSPFETATLADGSLVHGYANLPAMLVVLAITGIIIRGTSGSAWFNALVVALHPHQHGQFRRVWLERHSAWGGGSVFCVHWLRHCGHYGPGNQESAAQHAHWHPRLTRGLYHSVRAVRPRAYRLSQL
jgi:APA family basic amino acid/polyamine antiporter